MHNMKVNSDDFRVDTVVGKGTVVHIAVRQAGGARVTGREDAGGPRTDDKTPSVTPPSSGVGCVTPACRRPTWQR